MTLKAQATVLHRSADTSQRLASDRKSIFWKYTAATR
eukprot:CAMPEP_0119138160 /NCGR_PEP_ID=MMETSP1310-20130426/25139_1 /TAXON_ID=464262 /ORGANISM="Genus nov. species nov., Strain RCC2339" /LENGTH=36 /DNA_ID= /DNA_START= /DNA_END= /DNA_ORIENTATION=